MRCGNVILVSVSLTQWSAFVEVCRTGSFRAAAEATGFSQPGLSRQIAALERSFGVKLLDRGPRGVAPTSAGHRTASPRPAGRQRGEAWPRGGAGLSRAAGAPGARCGPVHHGLARAPRGRRPAPDGGPDCFVVTALTRSSA